MSTESHRGDHIHNVMLNATFYVGISKLMAKLECSKSAAILYALNEGLFKEGAISQADHNSLAARYGRTLKDVILQKQTEKESHHTPVLEIEKARAVETVQHPVKRRLDYGKMSDVELQRQRDLAVVCGDVVSLQFIVFEQRKRKLG